jgi:biopolymer transport protein ExbD
MGVQDTRQSGSAAAVIAIVALLALFAIGALVVAGGSLWFFARKRAVESELIAREQSMIAEQEARRAQEMAEMARREAERQAVLARQIQMATESVAVPRIGRESIDDEPSAAGEPKTHREMVLTVNQDGRVVDGDRVLSLEEIQRRMQQATAEVDAAVSVVLQVDRRCRAGALLELQNRLVGAGMTKISLRLLEPTAATNAAPPAGAAEPEG